MCRGGICAVRRRGPQRVPRSGAGRCRIRQRTKLSPCPAATAGRSFFTHQHQALFLGSAWISTSAGCNLPMLNRGCQLSQHILSFIVHHPNLSNDLAYGTASMSCISSNKNHTSAVLRGCPNGALVI